MSRLVILIAVIATFLGAGLVFYGARSKTVELLPQTAEGCPEQKRGFLIWDTVVCLDDHVEAHFDVRADQDDKKSEFSSIYRIFWDNEAALHEHYGFPAGVRNIMLVGSTLADLQERQSAVASELPGLKRYSFAGRVYYLSEAELGFDVYCKPALSPKQHELGGEDCEVTFQIADRVYARISYGTLQWSGEPGWPKLDENWQNELVPTFQSAYRSVIQLIDVQ